uniref:Uncharacterized protein n=1 Tax=Kalanchoe fedtschenkoi TaxID=63787 RepID=A0A7N0TIY9_KALFE
MNPTQSSHLCFAREKWKWKKMLSRIKSAPARSSSEAVRSIAPARSSSGTVCFDEAKRLSNGGESSPKDGAGEKKRLAEKADKVMHIIFWGPH